MKNKIKGFSLVELVVVIAIMVVLVGVLVPSLIGYTESTRADKDTAQMEEVVTAIEMAMTNEEIYDDLLLYAVEDNYSCYADGDPNTNIAINRVEDFNVGGNAEGVVGGEDLWSYGDDARALAKTQYAPSGKMCGLTITFVHNYDAETKEFDIGNALINNMSPSHKKSNTVKLKDLNTDGTAHLYEYLKDIVTESITTNSAKYKNSEYTIFIRMVPVGVDYDKYENMTVEVYGQWSGSHLGVNTRRDSLDEVDGVDVINPGDYVPTPNAPVPQGPVPGIGATPQEPKAVATFVAPTVKDNLVYNEHDLPLINPGSSDEGTMYYKLQGGEWNTRIPTAQNAGTYTVYYYCKGDTDHYSSQEYSLTITIRKAVPNYNVPTAKTNLYADGTSKELVVAGRVSKGGRMLYKLTTTGYSTSVPMGKAPGTYTVLWQIEETDNYTGWPETTIEVTIGKLKTTFDAPVPRDLTYNGAMQQLVDPVKITSTEMPNDTPIVEYSLDGESWAQTIPSALNAGNYTVYYRLNANSYYEGTDGTDKVDVTIKKADPNVNIQWNDSVPYMANVSQTFVDAITQEGKQFVYFRIYEEGTDGSQILFSTYYPSAINAGTYIVDWYLPEDRNYVGIGSVMEPQSHTCVITKAIATDTNKIAVTGETWTYDKKEHAVAVGNSDGWSIVFTDANGDIVSDIPTATNAGTYTYTWTAEHAAFQTESGTVTLQCNKKPVQVVQQPYGQTQNGQIVCTQYINTRGVVVRTTYSPSQIHLQGRLIEGSCTEGGVWQYAGNNTFEATLTPSMRSAYYPIRWTLSPANSNYYIEGADEETGVLTGTTAITLKVTVPIRVIRVAS